MAKTPLSASSAPLKASLYARTAASAPPTAQPLIAIYAQRKSSAQADPQAMQAGISEAYCASLLFFAFANLSSTNSLKYDQ
jgi:hypothetical protein